MQPQPAVGIVEIYYPEGMRSRLIPAGTDVLAAAMEAHDLWEEENERVRVRVVRFMGDGRHVCVCHLPPKTE